MHNNFSVVFPVQLSSGPIWKPLLLGIAGRQIKGSFADSSPVNDSTHFCAWPLAVFTNRLLLSSRNFLCIARVACGSSGTISLITPWWPSWTACSSLRRRWRKETLDSAFRTGQTTRMRHTHTQNHKVFPWPPGHRLSYMRRWCARLTRGRF